MNVPAKDLSSFPAGTGSSASPRRVNKLAVSSLVVSIFGALSILFLFGAPCAVGIILGIVGLRRIKRAGGDQKGMTFAIAGIIVGLLFLAFGVAMVHASPCILNPNSPACTDKYLG